MISDNTTRNGQGSKLGEFREYSRQGNLTKRRLTNRDAIKQSYTRRIPADTLGKVPADYHFSAQRNTGLYSQAHNRLDQKFHRQFTGNPKDSPGSYTLKNSRANTLKKNFSPSSSKKFLSLSSSTKHLSPSSSKKYLSPSSLKKYLNTSTLKNFRRTEEFRVQSERRGSRQNDWKYRQEGHPLPEMVAHEYQSLYPLKYQNTYCADVIWKKRKQSSIRKRSSSKTRVHRPPQRTYQCQGWEFDYRANCNKIPPRSFSCNSFLSTKASDADKSETFRGQYDTTCDICKSQNITTATSRDKFECQECTSAGESTRLQGWYQSRIASDDLSSRRDCLCKLDAFTDNPITNKCMEFITSDLPTVKQKGFCVDCISTGFPLSDDYCINETQLANQDANSNWDNLTACGCKSQSCIDGVSLLVNSSSLALDVVHSSCDCRENLGSIKRIMSPPNSLLLNDYCELCNTEYEACPPYCQDCVIAGLGPGIKGISAGKEHDSTRHWMNNGVVTHKFRKLRHKLKKTHPEDRRNRHASMRRWRNTVTSCLRCVFPVGSSDESSSDGSGSDDEGDDDDGADEAEYIEHADAGSDGPDSDGGSDSGSDENESLDSIDMLEDQLNALDMKDNGGGNASDGGGEPGSEQTDSLTELGSGESEEDTGSSENDDDSVSDMENDDDSYFEDLQSILIDERE